MTSLPCTYPDQITDWQHAKEIRRGGNQAIEDKALQAYHDAINAGQTREQAEQQYFKTFKYNTHEQR